MQKLLLLTVIFGGLTLYFNAPGAGNKQAKAEFVPIIAPDHAEVGKVLVIGPTCNSQNGLRTKALIEQLAQAGIPYSQTASPQFTNPALSNPQEMERLNQLMGGQTPIVIVNGRGKANPAIEEVVAEFRQSGTTLRF